MWRIGASAWKRVQPRAPIATAAAAAAAAAATLASATAPPAKADDAADVTQPKKLPCLHLHLTADSAKRLASEYPPTHSRALAERVLLRPCLEHAHERLPLTPLAYVRDDTVQALLLLVDGGNYPMGPAPPDGMGYPVLPISLAENDEEESPPAQAPSPATADSGGSAPLAPAAGEVSMSAASPAPAAASTAIGGGGGGGVGVNDDDDDDDDELPLGSPWDMVEGPWRRLEAAGVLTVERGPDALPVSVSLPDGARSWRGELAGGGMTEVRLLSGDDAKNLQLFGRAAEPECAFCRFMKNGPCGAQFQRWEDCIDRARDQEADFVDLCGKETLVLKECTDKHPEYYGALSPDADDKADAKSPTEPSVDAAGDASTESATEPTAAA